MSEASPDAAGTVDAVEDQRHRPPIVAVTGRVLTAGRIRGWAREAAGIQRAYLDALRRAGGLPVIVDPIALDASQAHSFIASFDAVVLTGGPDVDPALYGEERHVSVYGVDREADDFEIAVCRAAIDNQIPLLAICRGIQVVNVALGGSLVQHLPDDKTRSAHGTPGVLGGELLHDVRIEAGSLLAAVLGSHTVHCSCHHHQAIARPGERVRVTAAASDQIVEGLEVEGAWVLAVQWHPEDTAAEDPAQQRLFDALVERARLRSAGVR